MTKLLINNTEQERTDNGTDILLFGRGPDEPEARQVVRVRGFEPHFYAEEDEARQNEGYLLAQDTIVGIDYECDDGFYGESLAKVTTRRPSDVREARELFDDTWAADVAFTNRFRIDHGIKAYIDVPDSAWNEQDEEYICVPQEITSIEPPFDDVTPGLEDVEPRVVTLDIEVDDRADGFPEMGDERILSIVAHDSYSGDAAAFVDTEGGTESAVADRFGGNIPAAASDVHGSLDSLYLEPTEERMLIAFRSWFQKYDPDIVTGWNADDFDIPFIIERMEKLSKLNEDVLSPMGWAGVTSRGEPRIKGRTVYDLLDVYKENSYTEIESYSLDGVAEEELGESKLHFDGSFYDLYQDELDRFIEYNARDVMLAVRINEEADVIAFRDTLRREVGVDFEDSYKNKDFLDMMCRRKLSKRGAVGPTRPAWDEITSSDYEGGAVFDAYSGIAGNVVGIDLSSLYPYTMAMFNASPEMKIDIEEAEADGIPYTEAPNGTAFRLDQDGLFKELVDDAIGLKSEYKAKIRNADSKAEREEYEQKYMSAKTITNSIYGVTGWERFFLYDEGVAEAITLAGQAVIKRTAEAVENRDEDTTVIYGDTDSCYIKFPDRHTPETCLDIAESICDELNDEIYPAFASEFNIPEEDCLWEIEREVFMERFFQAGKKKRYAYLATWKDGSWLDEPSVEISGFETQRSDSAPLTSDLQEKVIDELLHGNVGTIREIIYEYAEAVRADEPEWDQIGIPGGLGKKITDSPATAESDDYYNVSCGNHFCYPQDAHPRAAYNANKLLGTNIGEGDKPKRVYVKEQTYGGDRAIDVIAFTDAAQIAGADVAIELDTSRMLNRLIAQPMREICDAVGVDVTAAIRGQEQTGLGVF